LVTGSLSGVFKLLDSVLEFNPLNDLRHAVCTIEFAPFTLCRDNQLEGYGEASFAAEATLRFPGSVADRYAGAFDRIGCADAFPVRGWDVIESEQHASVFCQFPDCFIVFHAVGCCQKN
jgi:hypothetical protein